MHFSMHTSRPSRQCCGTGRGHVLVGHFFVMHWKNIIVQYSTQYCEYGFVPRAGNVDERTTRIIHPVT